VPTEPSAVEHGGEAFGQAVELVEALRQDFVQALLVLQVQRRADRADHLQRVQRGRVEVGVVQQRDHLRRHHDHMGDPLGGDLPQHRGRLEAGMQDVAAADEHPGHEVDHGAIEDDRTGVQHDAFRRHAETHREDRAVVGAHVVAVHDPLGRAGGAAGVHDVVEVVVDQTRVRRLVGGGTGEELVATDEAIRQVAAGADQDVTILRDGRQLGLQSSEAFGEGRIGEDHDAVGIPQQGLQPGFLEQRAERHDH
jgi:hypothetical protein